MDVHSTKNVSIGIDPYPFGGMLFSDKRITTTQAGQNSLEIQTMNSWYSLLSSNCCSLVRVGLPPFQ